MQIKRDGLFFKFLSLYDGETWDLDSCKVVKLILRNLFMSILFFIIAPFTVLLALYMIGLLPFFMAADGVVFLGIITAMVVYGSPFFIWYKVSNEKIEDFGEDTPKEPSIASQLYDSWKNKYCLKVEVV